MSLRPDSPQQADVNPLESRAATDRRRDAWRNPLLWTLQGWLAMFYIAAGYAKLTESQELLTLMLGWPAGVRRETLLAVGMAEIGLACAMLAPALSWRAFHGLLVGSAALIFLLAGGMAVVHLLLADAELVGINAALMIVAAIVLYGRRRRPIRR